MPVKDEYDDRKWTAHAATYDSNVGYMSRIAADRLVQPTDSMLPYADPNSSALDIGAGTGSLTIQLSRRFPSVPILATDISAGMLAVIEALRLPNVTTRIADASRAGALEAGSASHVLNTLMVQFLPDPQDAVEGMCRALRLGGVLGLGIWDEKNEPNRAWARACRALDPGYRVPKPHDESAWYSTGELEKALGDAGLEEVKSGGCVGKACAREHGEFCEVLVRGRESGDSVDGG
jgi:ubiquinone/menaquinone biosynthesis C-methylase UbiE